MPIIKKSSPTNAPPNVSNPSEIPSRSPPVTDLKVPYKTATVDSRHTPLQSLLQHVSGSTWTIEYYSQILDSDNELSPIQLSRQAAYQQYCRIDQLEVKVEAPLTETQDPESKAFTVEGNATIYSGLVPNLGDMFVADIGDGRQGIFSVLESVKKTYLKNAVYEIRYQLKDYLNQTYQTDLDNKTVRHVKFVRELLYLNSSSNLLNQDYAERVDLYREYQQLVRYYIADFFSTEHRTFMIPGQERPSYDPWLARTLVNWLDSSEHRVLQQVRLPDLDPDPAYRNTTIWDCITEGSDALLPLCQTQVQLIDTVYFKQYARLGGIYYSSIGRVLYPFDGRTDVDRFHNQHFAAANGAHIGTAGHRSSTTPITTPEYHMLDGLVLPHEIMIQDLPDFASVRQDTYYVFTEAFYKRSDVLSSHLERLTFDLIAGRVIDRTTLIRLLSKYMRLPELERFYYGPVLFALIKAVLRKN